jgi:competence ComEA-like helix-hairpin-helix protein
MPPSEVRALLLLLALAVAGQGARYLLSRPGEPPGQIQLLATLSPGSPLAQRDSAKRQARPIHPGELIDVDHASAAELARLPKVGPRLAKAIVADREAHGPFHTLAGLDRVSGIGPGLLRLVAPHVSFSGAGSETPVAVPGPLNINGATIAELDALSGIGPAKAAAILRYREQHGRFNSVSELERVPGFGPAAVARLRDQLAAH